MVNLIIIIVFVALLVSIWLLRNNVSDYIEKEENSTEKKTEQLVVDNKPYEISCEDVHINEGPSKTVNSESSIHQTNNNTYPDSDIETQTVELPESPSTDDSSSKLVYANIADYFAGKLNDIPQQSDVVIDADESISLKNDSNNNSQSTVQDNVIWSGDTLDDEKNSRTVILADEMIPGDAYVYYRQNMNRETFKGLVIADKRLDDDHKNGVVRTRYARQAISSEYKRGFIMRSSEINSLKFYVATKEEIVSFLSGCPETKADLDYILGPYKEKYQI